MERPTKRYIVWIYNSENGYTPYEYETVIECLLHEKYSSKWYITESINDISASGYYTKPKPEVPVR